MAKKKSAKKTTRTKAKQQTPTAAEAAAARGRMRARKATADSVVAAKASDKAELANINREIHSIVSSGASVIRPKSLEKLQERGAVIAKRMRARRKTT